MHIKSRLKPRGFSLLEVLMAMAISSVVLIGSYTLLDSVLRTDERLSAKREQLEVLQRAFHVMQQDMEQVVARSVRTEFGERETAIKFNGIDQSFEFTRLGWRNPIGRTRSNMQRVAYLVDNGHLIRKHWNVLDRASETEAKENILLEGVNDLQLRFYTLELGGQWVSDWNQSLGDKETLPKAIEITLDTEYWGELRRVYSLVDNLEDNFKGDQ